MRFYNSCEGIVIIEEYDKKSLYPMFIKCHNHLHHVLEYEVGCVDLMIETIIIWIYFEQIANIKV
jgi:hypothetical protein